MGNNRNSKDLLPREVQALLSNLKIRFEKNKNRHSGIFWKSRPQNFTVWIRKYTIKKIWSLNQMEITDGELDVVKFDTDLNEYIFMIVRLKVQKVVEVFVTIVQA